MWTPWPWVIWACISGLGARTLESPYTTHGARSQTQGFPLSSWAGLTLLQSLWVQWGSLTSRTRWHLASDSCLRCEGLFSEGVESFLQEPRPLVVIPHPLTGQLLCARISPQHWGKWIKESTWWQQTRIKLSPSSKYPSRYNTLVLVSFSDLMG